MAQLPLVHAPPQPEDTWRGHEGCGMTLWSASDPVSPFFMLLRGSKQSDKPPSHLFPQLPHSNRRLLFLPQPSVSLPFLLLSFGLSTPPSFYVSPTPSESHHTDSEAEISHRDLGKWPGGGKTTVWHLVPTNYIQLHSRCLQL